jgi:hypothetical protein
MLIFHVAEAFAHLVLDPNCLRREMQRQSSRRLLHVILRYCVPAAELTVAY